MSAMVSLSFWGVAYDRRDNAFLAHVTAWGAVSAGFIAATSKKSALVITGRQHVITKPALRDQTGTSAQ
jgi:hypothetical protein